MAIEADRQAIIDLPMTTQMLQSLRESARLLSTHYSTQIEGNRLTEAQVKEVIEGGGRFPGRERDEAEVRNYFRALEFIEGQAREQVGVSETLIQRIHGLTYHGRPTPTAYRDGLKGIYALEAYYARRLEDYYEALDVGEGHNYYVGNRAQADVTGFIEYFVRGMADSFAKVREQASKQKSLGQRDQSSVLRNLSPTQRQMLELFRDQAAINAKDLATLQGLPAASITLLPAMGRAGFPCRC